LAPVSAKVGVAAPIHVTSPTCGGRPKIPKNFPIHRTMRRQKVYRLLGLTAVITGAAQGIGRGIAEGFALEGADVALIDVQPAKSSARSLAAIRSLGRKAMYVRADVSDEQQVRQAMENIRESFHHIDVLVNNAGIAHECLVESLDVAEWDRMMAVNLRGVFLCTRFVLPQMLRQGSGRIINIASQQGQIGAPTMAHYSASKAGVIGFTKALAKEVAARNVLVNAIAPGPINTDMLTLHNGELDLARFAALPIARFGSVAEVVPTAVFLASADSTYYVGQTLGPNGGDVVL
jgi:3-oxoacyl-[acyl-carrier protein] reductase